MPPRLGELLVKDGACAPSAVREALQSQIIFGGRLGTNLLELGSVSEEALARTLGRRFGVPSLCGDLRLDPAAVGLLRSDIADRYDVIPYVVADRKLALLAIDPADLTMLDEVAFVTGKSIHPIVVPEARLWALLKSTYGVERQLRGLDVDFATLREAAVPAPVAKAPDALSGDLMGEDDFDAIYAKTAPYALAPAVQAPAAPPVPAPPPRGSTPPAAEDDVVELTDLLAEPEPEPAASALPPVTQDLLRTLYGRSGHAPPRAPVARPPEPPRRSEPEPSPLSFEEALRFLEGVQDRGSIAHTVLRYARSKFRRAVLLTVHRGAVQGWAGLGEQLGTRDIRRISIPVGAPGILETVVRTRAHLLGPIPKTEANVRFLKQLGGGVPTNAFLVPILALGRVVNVFYVDAGRGQTVDASAVGELLILATRIAKSYDALLSRVR